MLINNPTGGAGGPGTTNVLTTYHSTPPTLTNGQTDGLESDSQGGLKVYLDSALFGEVAPGNLVGDATISAVRTGGILTGGVYNTTDPAATNGQPVCLQTDAAGNLKVISSFKSAPINTATTTTAKTGAGLLHSLIILGGSAGAITIYDNTAGSGTVLVPTFTAGSVTVPVALPLDMSFSTGLTIVTGAATILAVTYR